MSNSKLTSLLQYRFVKKDSASPQTSQSSGSVTLSPSQSTTQSPVTPNKSNAQSSQSATTPGKNRGYLFFSVKDRNLFHGVDTIVNIFTCGEATSENITNGVHEMK